MNCFGSDNVLDEIQSDISVFEDNSYISEVKKNIDKEYQTVNEKKKCCCFVNRCFYIEALPGYYYPNEKRMREIYGNGGFNGQLDVGYFFTKKIAFFLRGGAYWNKGESTVLGNTTRVILANITFGLKYVVPIFNRLHYYAGGGGRVFFLRIKNDSDFVQRKVSANKLGGAFVTGFWIYPSRHRRLFLDIFLDYSFYKFNFKKSIASERNGLHVKDPTIGIGLGYQF